MQTRSSLAMAVLLSGLILLTLLAAAHACGGHASHPWDKVVEMKGRRRSLLSMKGRRCASNTLMLANEV